MPQANRPRYRVGGQRYKTLKNTVSPASSPDSLNEPFYQQMFERNRAIQLIIDPKTGNILNANPAACEFYGYTAEHFKTLALPHINTMPPEQIRQRVQDTFTKGSVSFESMHRLASGEIRDVDIFAGVIDSGDHPYIHAIVQDITARKKSEKALRRSQKAYDILTRLMPDSAVIMIDKDLRYTFAEGSYLESFGSLYDNIVGKQLQDVFPAGSARDNLEAMYRRVLRGETFTFEQITPDLAYEAYLAPIPDDDGQIVGGILLAHDILKRINAEKALRESDKLYRTLVQRMPNSCMVLFDTEMRYMLADGPYLKHFGEDWPNAIGKLPEEVLPPEAAQTHRALYQRALNGESFSYDRVTEKYAFQAHLTPVYDDSGEYVIAGMLLAQDIQEIRKAEKALRESETRYRALVNFAPVGIIQADINGNRVFCNARWCEMVGITLDQALSFNTDQAIYPEDQAYANYVWKTMIATHRPFENAIFRYQRPDRTIVWVSASGHPLLDSDGNVTGYIATLTDFTERKQLETALRTSETRYRMLVDLAPVGIFELDTDGTYIFCNSHWREITGLTDPEIIGKTNQRIHPDDVDRIQELRQHMMDTGIPIENVEYRYVRPDGMTIWIANSIEPIRDEYERIVGYIGAVTDITLRVITEEALRQKEEQLQLITRNIHDLVVQTDNNGKMVYVSPSAQNMLGYEPHEMFAMKSVDLLHPDDREQVVEQLVHALRNEPGILTIEGRLRHSDGHTIPSEIVIKPLFNDQSQRIGSLVLARDITERRRLQELTIQKEKLLATLEKEQELNDLKTRMMQRIAHEFRTPLSIIQSATETLIHYFDRLSGEQRSTKAERIAHAIRRVTDMLDEIGMVIKGTFTPDHIHKLDTDLSYLCKQATIEVEHNFNLPDKFVLTDSEPIHALVDSQVLINALIHVMRNAARFSKPEDPVNVSLSHTENAAEIRVVDTGIGILPQEFQHIFEPFFRGSNIGEINGLGVGLTIARAAIEAHKGTIRVESVPGEGTTVIITLPLQ